MFTSPRGQPNNLLKRHILVIDYRWGASCSRLLRGFGAARMCETTTEHSECVQTTLQAARAVQGRPGK